MNAHIFDEPIYLRYFILNGNLCRKNRIDNPQMI